MSASKKQMSKIFVLHNFLSTIFSKITSLHKHEIISLLFIALTSFFLRFINYPNRWGLAYDQARDVIVSHQVFINMKLPITGPFSASGEFVFGPFWYWSYAFITALNPSSVIWPWIVQTFVSALMPLVMYFIGRKLYGWKFGLLLGFITAISTGQIAQSTNLTYSTFVGFISVFILLFFVFAFKTRKSLFFFLTTFFIGLSMNIHFQAVGYFFLLLILIFWKIKSLKTIFYMLTGFLIPFIPLLIFDFTNNHFQSSNIYEFLFNRNESGALQKRWLTYVGVFWTNAYSHIIGGFWLVGLVTSIIVFFVTIYSIIKKKLDPVIIIILIFLASNFIVLRYYKGNIFDAFLVYLHPFILLITAWVIYKIYSSYKYIGISIIILLSLFTMIKNYHEISNATNFRAIISEEYVMKLIEKYPGEKFAVYDFNFKTASVSNPAVMYLMKNTLTSDDGIKLGFVEATNSAELASYNAKLIAGEIGGEVLLDLNSYSHVELVEKGWTFVNPTAVYNSVLNWYKE